MFDIYNKIALMEFFLPFDQEKSDVFPFVVIPSSIAS